MRRWSRDRVDPDLLVVNESKKTPPWWSLLADRHGDLRADGANAGRHPASRSTHEHKEVTGPMTDTLSTAAPVTTGLYIGGKERSTAETLEIADPGKKGGVAGYAAAATKQDVSDAVAAAKAAFPAWSALSAQERAAQMAAAIAGHRRGARRGRRDPHRRRTARSCSRRGSTRWCSRSAGTSRCSLADEVDGDQGRFPPSPASRSRPRSPTSRSAW